MSVAAVLFPDVEMWATGYLRDALAARPESYTSNVYVGNAVPSTRRDRMVICRRDGGPRLDVVRELARLSVRVWAKTEADASDLALMVAALLWAGPDGNPVVKVQQSAGPSPVVDTSGQPLRLMGFELTVRGADI